MGRIISVMLWGWLCQSIAAQTVYDDFYIRSGVVTSNQTWQGKNILATDILIPEHITLTLAPNTWLIYNNNDAKNLGKYPDQVELITQGTLRQSPTQSARILTISDPHVQESLSRYKASDSLTIRPEPIDTQPLHSKVNRHKRHYIVTWTVIYSILLILF